MRNGFFALVMILLWRAIAGARLAFCSHYKTLWYEIAVD